MKRAGLLLLAFIGSLCGSPVFADPPTFGQVVSACGTPVRTTPQIGSEAPNTVNQAGQLCTVASAGTTAAITPIVSAAAEASHVLKASGGTLFSVYVTTGASAGYMLVFNATSAPGNGAVTPIECVSVPANTTAGISFAGQPPAAFATGITVEFSTTGCFTATSSATAFFQGIVQ